MRKVANNSVVRAQRVWVLSLLTGWLWGIDAIVQDYEFYKDLKLHSDFFPEVFCSPLLAAILFSTVIATSILALAISDSRLWWVNYGAILIASLFLILGPFGFAWQFPITTFWGSWLYLWLILRRENSTSYIDLVGPRISLMVVSLVFFGGVWGKWTQGYWSGEVFSFLIFAYQPEAKYTLLRESVSESTMSMIATNFSRVAILVETLLSCVWLFPRRIGLVFSFLMLTGMWMMSPIGIIDAIGPLFGVVLAGLFLLPSRQFSLGMNGASSKRQDTHMVD